MFVWISALLGVLLSLGGPMLAPAPETVVGIVRVDGPVLLNGNKVTSSAVVTSGDRLETGPGGVASLNVSSTDRLILSERSAMRLQSNNDGVSAQVDTGRLQVNTDHQRLREVRLTDEGVSITSAPGVPHDYMVTRQADVSYVWARHGGVTITDEGYGGVREVPEGKVGTVRTELVHLDPPPPMPQQRPTPASTTSGERRAGQATAVIPADFVTPSNGKGVKKELTKGSVINIDDLVASGDKGRVRMALDDGSILSLGSNSQMHIIQHDAKSQATNVELVAGRVRAQVAKLANPQTAWEIRTSTAVCGVLGTDFFVETDGQKTRLVVFQGKVRFTPLTRGVVAAGASTITVAAGQTSTSVAGAVAAPAASGGTTTAAAAASTTISSQGASAAGQVAATAASRVGVVATTAVPAAATGGAVVGGQQTNNNNGGSLITNTGSPNCISPHVLDPVTNACTP
jgi:hypothetical protein